MRPRGSRSSRAGTGHDRPRQEWIEIPVPALISEDAFALAQEQLQKNKRFASRRAIRPTLLQSLLVCHQCGYALYGTSGGRKPNNIRYYYRCIGSDSWRHLHGSVCQNRPVRQDYLDDIIWREVLRLLQEPQLMQNEIQRRLQEAKKADPLRQREQYLNREQARLQSKIERLVTAYQEELIALEQLRQRMPELRKQEQSVRAELQSLFMAAQDQSHYLRVVDSLSDFRTRLQGNAERLDLISRRKIIRLLVKEVLVGTDTITIRHSIPFTNPKPQPTGPDSSAAAPQAGPTERYRLCTGSNRSPLRRTPTFVPIARTTPSISALVRFFHRSFQPHLDQMQHGSVHDPTGYRLDKLGMRNTVVVASEICINNFLMASVDQPMDVSYGVQCAAVSPIGVLFRL